MTVRFLSSFFCFRYSQRYLCRCFVSFKLWSRSFIYIFSSFSGSVWASVVSCIHNIYLHFFFFLRHRTYSSYSTLIDAKQKTNKWNFILWILWRKKNDLSELDSVARDKLIITCNTSWSRGKKTKQFCNIVKNSAQFYRRFAFHCDSICFRSLSKFNASYMYTFFSIFGTFISNATFG